MSEYDEDEKRAYKALELREGASLAEIRKQRDKLARELHSDVNKAGDEDRLKKINSAYETLTNPAQIKAREQAKRSAAAAKAKADAARRAAEAKAEAARKQRARNAKESEMFGARLRGQAGAGTRHRAPKAPPSITPTPPPPPAQRPKPTSTPLLLRVAFLGAPIGIMALVVPANNAHHSPFLDVISVVCFFWLLAGIAGLFLVE